MFKTCFNIFNLFVGKLRMRLVFFLLTILAVQAVNGQTWTGNVNNNWHEAGNWSTGTIPNAGSTVTIGSVSSKPYPVITQNATVKTINLSDWSNGELTVSNNAKLTISEELDIRNNGHLYVDSGTLQFDGNKFSMGYTGSLIQVTNNGTFNSSASKILINGELRLSGGSMNLGNGFELSSGKLFHVTDGNINIYGQTNIYGTIDGGIGNFVFQGNLSNNQHQVLVRSGGRFYMSPSSPENHPLVCLPETPEPPALSGGTIDFFLPAFIENNGRLYGGDALVSFYQSTNTQGDAGIEVHNGTIVFKGNSVVSNSGFMKITCQGAIEVEGNSTFQQSGSIEVANGNFSVTGDAVFQNSGILNADGGDITFEGNITIANTGGTINAGSSTIYFSGGTFENSGTFNPGTSTFIFDGDGSQIITGKKTDISFYNLIVEDGANVQSSQNVLVLNDMEVAESGEFNVDPGKTLDVVGAVTGENNIGTNRPYIIKIVTNSSNTITAVFNEPLNPASAQTASNYRIENKAENTINNPSNPTLGGVNNNEVTLTLGFEIQQDVNYYLIVNNVYNLNNYSVNINHKKRFSQQEDPDLWQWAGTIDTDWDKPQNWLKNTLPQAGSQVVIPVTFNNPVISSSNNTINKLQIKTGASLTIGPTGSLQVNDSIINPGGTAGLIIASTSDGTGSLVHFNNEVNATFQRYISGEPQAWQMISSPVAGQSISGDFTPTGGSDAYGDGTRYDFYAWHEPDTSWVYLLNNNQPPTWLTANGSNNFIPGKGYLISYKDPHPTKEFKGPLNNGPVYVQLTNTQNGAIQFGHNLVGNPYPSSIDWKASSGWNRNTLENNSGGYDFWIWSEKNLNYGAYNSASNSDSGTLGVSRYIAPTQGFFVKAGQSGTLSMDNQVRVGEEAGNWLKSAATEQNNISVTIESLAGYGQDEVLIEFGYQGTEGGALKKFSFVPSSPSLYLPSDDNSYSIRTVGEPENHPVIPLSFKAGISGSYIFTANFPQNGFETLKLFDRTTGAWHNFKESQTYSFEATKGDNPERFVLQVMPGVYADPYQELPVHIFINQKKLNIDLRLVDGDYICEVFSITGQILLKTDVYGGEFAEFKIPSVSGVLVVQVTGTQGGKSQKVVVY
jgi:hypothetical protein